MKRFFTLMTLVLIAGCGPTEAPAPLDTMAGYAAFGAAITPEAAVPVQAVVAERTAYLGQPVKIEGRIAEVCQAKGCWVTLQAEGANVRVHVPRDADGNYVFTLPKDASGQWAVIEGTLTKTALDPEEAAHYEEDGAQLPAADLELQVAATGVLIKKSKT